MKLLRDRVLVAISLGLGEFRDDSGAGVILFDPRMLGMSEDLPLYRENQIMERGIPGRHKRVPPSMRASAAQKIRSADKVQKVLQDTDVLAIDVDGTITKDDGIDALAETECDAAISQEVKAWTAKAARGEVSIGEAIDERMRLLKPNATLVASDHLREPNRLMPGAYEFIQHACYYKKVPVYFVSAGLRANCIIVANMLDLPSPSDAVYGVELVFNSFGEYVDWDTTSLTSQPRGKSQALTHIANKIKSDPKTSNTSITIIGDGSADAAAKLDGAAANFIAFGDGAHRPKINRVADATAECFSTLLNNWH